MKQFIVDGGGWPAGTTPGRPRLRLFTFLSVVWTLVSTIALIPFWGGLPSTWGTLELECAVLLALHPVWIACALGAWRTEGPRPIPRDRGFRRHDPRRID